MLRCRLFAHVAGEKCETHAQLFYGCHMSRNGCLRNMMAFKFKNFLNDFSSNKYPNDLNILFTPLSRHSNTSQPHRRVDVAGGVRDHVVFDVWPRKWGTQAFSVRWAKKAAPSAGGAKSILLHLAVSLGCGHGVGVHLFFFFMFTTILYALHVVFPSWQKQLGACFSSHKRFECWDKLFQLYQTIWVNAVVGPMQPPYSPPA